MPFQVEYVFFDSVVVLRPTRYNDERGYFEETYRADEFIRMGLPTDFVQDNHSKSTRGVLRGMHYQVDQPMGKLLRVVTGSAFFAEVDVRQESATFGEFVTIELSEQNGRLLWVPPGFANGFCVTSDEAHISYKCTAIYNPEGQKSFHPLSAQLNIPWPEEELVLSERDSAAAEYKCENV
ncbi:MAG: dTDP-4-dehydrorhamnose 3,5-epimerase [Ignavibacteria bacterium]|nr:dTDP-4-dehydrorhamnose 3,5-epimerase [Ignavibacteria bacterium]